MRGDTGVSALRLDCLLGRVKARRVAGVGVWGSRRAPAVHRDVGGSTSLPALQETDALPWTGKRKIKQAR